MKRRSQSEIRRGVLEIDARGALISECKINFCLHFDEGKSCLPLDAQLRYATLSTTSDSAYSRKQPDVPDKSAH
jgi:hypothetical protein